MISTPTWRLFGSGCAIVLSLAVLVSACRRERATPPDGYIQDALRVLIASMTNLYASSTPIDSNDMASKLLEVCIQRDNRFSMQSFPSAGVSWDAATIRCFLPRCLDTNTLTILVAASFGDTNEATGIYVVDAYRGGFNIHRVDRRRFDGFNRISSGFLLLSISQAHTSKVALVVELWPLVSPKQSPQFDQEAP